MNPIEEMRTRLTERFAGATKPLSGIRVTANDMPRLPQSRIRQPKVKYDNAGRPPKTQETLPKKKSIWEGWL